MSNKNVQSSRTKRSKSLLQQQVARRQRRVLTELLEGRVLFTSAIGLTVGNDTVTNTATGVSGSVNILFNVPAGLTYSLAGYQTEVDLSPTITGVALTAAAPSNYIFTGQTPTNDSSSANPDALDVYDYLPSAGQADLITNGAGLEQVNFQIPAGVTGMYTLTLSPTNTILSDASGSAIPLGTLNAGTITINPPAGTTVAPTVTTNPSSQTLTAGQDASFTAAASGTPTPTVQWFVEPSGSSSFSALSGQTSTTLDLGASTTTESGNQYEAVFTNSAGSATTTAATLTVNPVVVTAAPVVTTNPSSQTLTVGQDASFTAAATGTPTPTVQWYVEASGSSSFSALGGQTATTLDLGSATLAESGNQYEAIFTNSAGTATTTPATLTVNPVVVTAAPVVTTNPTSQSLTVGQDANFTAAATGTPTPTVQWFVEASGSSIFTALGGQTSTTLDLGSATLAESGNKYEAIFTNTAGAATTTAATLTVTPVTTTGGSITGVQTTAASSYNLTQLGTGDWAHWGTGGSAGSFVHKATGGSLISNVSTVGSGNFGGYVDPTRNVSWTDGTPIAKDADDSGYIWANNGIGAGYSFTVPATTTPQTLYVYLGGFSSGSTLTAHLSNSSATDFVDTLSSSGHYNDIVAITYNAASAGQTLTITYVKSQNINGTNGSSDLIAAWLGAQPSAPGIITNPISASVAAGSTATFTASASGTPTPSVQWQVSVAGGAFTNIPGATSTTYSFTANTGENGNQYQAVFTNTGGSATTSAATLTVAAQSGVLSGVNSTAASSYNLTSLGTLDWIHFGVGGNPGTVDRKANVAPEISNVTKIGSGNFGGYVDSTRNVSWTDGTPTPSVADDSGYIWANNGIGAGYSFTAPADLTTRTIYVYLGGYSAGSTLTAHLSGTSVPDYVLNLSSAGHYNDIVAITYQASSPGQTLTLSYVKSSNVNGTNGSADLIAAWLA